MKQPYFPHLTLTAFLLVGFLSLFMTSSLSAQHIYPNHFRTGVGFAYILEGDNSGALFSQQYTRELTDNIHFAISGEYLSSSRYDHQRSLFTSRKAFVMFDSSVFFDLTETGRYTIKLGFGPAVRRRSELDLLRGTTSNSGTVTPIAGTDESFIHKRERDFGGKAVIESDFFDNNRLFFGMRASGYMYNKGTTIFAVGVNMGYSF